MLDLLFKTRKWDKEDKKKEEEQKRQQEELRKLKRGKYLYLDSEPWYQKMQETKVERETSPPDSSQKSSEPEEPKPKKKRKRIRDKFNLNYECRCLYRESKTLVSEIRKEVERDMKNRNKTPDKPNYHKRD